MKTRSGEWTLTGCSPSFYFEKNIITVVLIIPETNQCVKAYHPNSCAGSEELEMVCVDK